MKEVGEMKMEDDLNMTQHERVVVALDAAGIAEQDVQRILVYRNVGSEENICKEWKTSICSTYEQVPLNNRKWYEYRYAYLIDKEIQEETSNTNARIST